MACGSVSGEHGSGYHGLRYGRYGQTGILGIGIFELGCGCVTLIEVHLGMCLHSSLIWTYVLFKVIFSPSTCESLSAVA